MVEGEISFGRFRLDLARRELRRDQKPVRLGSRALDILCVLVSAEGRVVTKDELMARVGPGSSSRNTTFRCTSRRCAERSRKTGTEEAGS
jgi:DNA-binding winged helix-turn-helix (wHTH) protein